MYKSDTTRAALDIYPLTKSACKLTEKTYPGDWGTSKIIIIVTSINIIFYVEN